MVMSASPLKADVYGALANVGYGPEADISGLMCHHHKACCGSRQQLGFPV
jgi:hypothetical protein